MGQAPGALRLTPKTRLKSRQWRGPVPGRFPYNNNKVSAPRRTGPRDPSNEEVSHGSQEQGRASVRTLFSTQKFSNLQLEGPPPGRTPPPKVCSSPSGRACWTISKRVLPLEGGPVEPLSKSFLNRGARASTTVCSRGASATTNVVGRPLNMQGGV